MWKGAVIVVAVWITGCAYTPEKAPCAPRDEAKSFVSIDSEGVEPCKKELFESVSLLASR